MEIRLGKLSSIFPLSQIILAVIGSLHLDTNFRITCPFIKKKKKGFWDQNWVIVSLQINLGKTDVLAIWNLPIC